MAKKTLTDFAEENGKLKAENAALKAQLKAAKATTSATSTPAWNRDEVLNWVRRNLADVVSDLRMIPGVLPEASAPATDPTTTAAPAATTTISLAQGQTWLEGIGNDDWKKAVQSSARKRSGLMAKMIAHY